MALLFGAGLGLAQDVVIRGSASQLGVHAEVQAGIYDVKVLAENFASVEVRRVRVGSGSVIVVPPIRLEFIAFGDCGGVRRPDYYRLSDGGTGAGGLAGTAAGGALVTLFARGTGRVGFIRTGADGQFDFSGLQAVRDYSITIKQDGYFVEELSDLTVVPGFVSVFETIEREPCSPGHCLPALKAIRVLPACA